MVNAATQHPSSLTAAFSQILGWPIFREPGTGWRRHAAAALIALCASGVGILSHNLFDQAREPRFVADNHARLSLEQALALTLCGRYGAVGSQYLNPTGSIHFY